MDTNTATALLYGLKMDTDSFNRGVTDFDFSWKNHKACAESAGTEQRDHVIRCNQQFRDTVAHPGIICFQIGNATTAAGNYFVFNFGIKVNFRRIFFITLNVS